MPQRYNIYMNNNPENQTENNSENNTENDAETAGQNTEGLENGPEARQEELPDGSAERSSEEEITGVLEEMDGLDQEIFNTKKSAAETKQEIARLRESLGAPSTDEEPPSAEIENEKIEKLEEQKNELEKQKEEWIEQHGRENLPKGLAMGSGENGREANGSPENDEEEFEEEIKNLEEEEKKQKRKERKEDLEQRKEWLKEWEEDAIFQFEGTMRKDWRTNDAVNLELAIKVMKTRVPKAMEEKAKEYTEGKVDECPFSTVFIHWEVSSILERLLSKNPNYIRKMEVKFDEESVKIADEKDLKPEEKKDGDKTAEEGEKNGSEKTERGKEIDSGEENNGEERRKEGAPEEKGNGDVGNEPERLEQTA
jgi:hypothetical protein